MTSDQIYDEFVEDFRPRKFVGGLLPALIDFLLELRAPERSLSNFDEFLEEFPQQERTAAGKRANTLIVQRPDESTLSIRPFYNEIERFYRAEKHRHDFPSCAPHATQAWGDYRAWIDGLLNLDSEELQALRRRVIAHVLDELPDREFDPTSIRLDPPLFRRVLEELEFKAPKGEPTGAAFQGAGFGFIRADNPHLQVEIGKVRTGSARLQRVGDIDAWEGERLAVTAEVKFFVLEEGDVDDISNFTNEVNRRGAIGLVIAQDFSDEARASLLAAGLKPLSIPDLIKVVELWDPAKQRIAVNSMVYYAGRVEKNSVLVGRLRAFLERIEESGGGE